MKTILSMLLLCFVSIAITAQTAEIIVNYDYTFPHQYGMMKTDKMALLASQTEAKYYNNMSQWVDSMKSTPEGKAKYMDIFEKSCMSVEPDGVVVYDLSKGPTKRIYNYVITKLGDESLTIYDKYGEDLGYYTEPLAEMKWTMVEDSTTTVLGYECFMAESDYHGRHWKAWFSPEIPMSFGPWKLHGLPGLILKAEANGGFSFIATGLEETNRPIEPVYLLQDYAIVDRKKAQQEGEHYINNEEDILNAQGQNVKMYSVDENGNLVEIPKYDGLKHNLEPDYKIK